MTDNSPAAPAGWYPAPHANGQQRYWDGTQWTDWTPESAEAARQATALAEPTMVGAPTGGPVKKKGLRWWAWLLIGMGVLVLLIVIIGSLNGSRSGAVADRDADSRRIASQAPEPEREDTRVQVPNVVGLTVGEARGAIEAAGLKFKTVDGAGDDWVVATQTLTQPSEPGTEVFVTAAAPAPVLTTGQQNAVRKAESYLSFTAFSRTSLIEQLEYEGFTTEDATFAVDFVAPDWNAQAAEKAKSYMEMTAFSRASLIDQLLYEGFDQAQAEYGAAAVGY